jgi:DNA-binding NarL/FixJ family response regulator
VIEIVLVAPVRAYRDAIAAALRATPEISSVMHGPTFLEAVAPIAPRQPAVTLVDFGVPDLLATLLGVRRQSPTTRVLGLGIESNRAHSESVIRAAEAGLVGFIDADQPIDDVISSVRLALRGQSPCSPRIAALLLQAMQRRPAPPPLPASAAMDAGPSALTPREKVVANLAALGLTNRQIASRLVLGESTVKTHVHSILGKLGVEHREAIASLFPGDGLLTSPPVEVEASSGLHPRFVQG